GRNADSGAVEKDVGVQIDQARSHDLAGGAENPQGFISRNIGLERLDHAKADADVTPGPEILTRIEHLAALDDEIELVVRSHGGDRGAAPEAGERTQRRGAGEKLAP